MFALLKHCLREKHPLKCENDLKALFDELVFDRAPIEGVFWTKIVERMYDQADARALEEKVRENAHLRYQ